MADEKRLNCPMRHENGNCLPCGGFCTAVNDPICEALHNAFRNGESAECERFTLASIKESRKFQEEQLEALRAIYKKVISTSVDAVEVVRCENCIHSVSDGWICGGAGFTMPSHPTYPNSFCSDGERKDNDV